MHVERDILGRTSAKQFRYWEMYYEMEPFGEIRADYRAASIAQMIANVNRSKNQKAYTLQDCLLKFEGEREIKKTQTWQEQLKLVRAFAKAHATDEQLAKLESIPHISVEVSGPVRWPKVIEEGTT